MAKLIDLPPTSPECDPFLLSSKFSNVSDDAVIRWATSQLTSVPPISCAATVPESVASLEFKWPECKIIRAIGTGSFGEVFLATIGHAQLAVKVLVDAQALSAGSANHHASQAHDVSIKTTAVTSAPRSTMLKEVSIMASLRHPHIVQLMGFCLEPPCLALEFCARGSLYRVLSRGFNDPEAAAMLTWDRRLRMATDAAAGLLFLHSRFPQIVHRDFKTPNLLVALDWGVKVADMGLSKLLQDVNNESASTHGPSNPRWLAPEVLQGDAYIPECDVYSFGVVLWELLTWKLPWGEGNVWGIAGAVIRGERPRVPALEELPGPPPPNAATYRAYVNLMQRCWDQDPAKRPSIHTAADELSRLQ